MIDRIDSIVGQDTAPGVQSLSWTKDAAVRIRNLEKQQVVILLTPVVPHPSSGRSMSHAESETMASRSDPFECLGQTICTYQKKINHVPFVPGAGMLPIHKDMIANACAIVVVNAEPAAVEESAVEVSMAAQRKFATAVALETTTMAGPGEDPLPLVMLHCGTTVNAGPGQLKAAYCDYDIIMHAKDYAFTALVEAGHTLMGPS